MLVMPLPGWRTWAAWALAAVGTVAAAFAVAGLMYLSSPATAALAPVGLAAVAIILRRPVAGVCIGLLALPLEVVNIRVGLKSVTLAENLFLLTAIVGAAHLVLGGFGRIEAPHIAFAVLIVLSAGGLLHAEDTEVVQRITRVWLAYLVLSVLVAQASRAELHAVLLSLAASAGIIGFIALVSTGPQKSNADASVVSGRADTGFAHPNVLAFYLLLSLPAALVMMARPGSLKVRVPMGLAAVGIFGGLFLTLSRSALIGVVVALAVMLVWRGFRRMVGGLLALLLVFAAVNLSSLEKSSQIATVSQRLSTVDNLQGIQRDPRADIFSRTPEIIMDHLVFGTGEGNFPVVGPRYGLLDPANNLAYDHAHNIFLTFAAELGITGLAALLVFLFAVFASGRAVVRARGPDWPLGLAVGASLLALLFTSLAEYPPRTNVIMATVLILVGVLVGLQRGENTAGLGRGPA